MKKMTKKAAPKKSQKKVKAKPAKKTAKKVAKKPAKKNKKVVAKKKSKPAAKPKSNKKTLSIAELFALKKRKLEQQQGLQQNPEQTIPPHEVHDNAHLQQKPQGNTKIRSGAAGNRHH